VYAAVQSVRWGSDAGSDVGPKGFSSFSHQLQIAIPSSHHAAVKQGSPLKELFCQDKMEHNRFDVTILVQEVFVAI
jgi:hypothetical protein